MFDEWNEIDNYPEPLDFDDPEEELCGDEDCPWCYPITFESAY